MKYFLILLTAMLTAGGLFSQQTDLFIPREIQQAYENNTRSYSGKPGENYFQNHADYDINAEFHPKTGRLEGSEQITYHNNSPDTLKYIALRLYMNLYQKGIKKDYRVPPEDLHDGIEINRLTYNSRRIDSLDGHHTKNWKTIKMFPLPKPLKPGKKATLSIEWEVKLPEKKKYRFGEHGKNNWFVAYWYPRISVYDDIRGVYTGGRKLYVSRWYTNPWTGREEFYNGFSDYDVTLSVPKEYMVWATGILQEPEKHFNSDILKRFSKAHKSDTVVPIITTDDIQNNEILKAKNSWKFTAEHVPDFAFATARDYLWDGTSVMADSSESSRVFVDAVYPKDFKQFDKAAAIGRKVIDLFPDQVIPSSFPFPGFTVFNGGELGGGAVEFPMITNSEDSDNIVDLKLLVAHELIHNYFPFYVMTNESDYAFMDEGLTTFLERETLMSISSDNKPYKTPRFKGFFKYMSGSNREIPLMARSYVIADDPAYFQHAYGRPSIAFFTLKDMLGEKAFNETMKAFMERWEGKHPTPYDFFFTFEDVLNRDLSWFWEPWFFDFGYPDLAIEDVKNTDSGHHITIKQEGKLPVPVDLTVWLDNGSMKEINKSPAVWKNRDHYEVTLDSDQPIDSIKLEHQTVPDVYPENNQYRAAK